MRDIDSDRLEDGILAAQKGIKKGDPSALQALSRLITTKARLNGYLAPQKLEVSGKSGGPVEIKTVDDHELSFGSCAMRHGRGSIWMSCGNFPKSEFTDQVDSTTQFINRAKGSLGWSRVQQMTGVLSVRKKPIEMSFTP
jgi:hypothetical protein